MQRGKALAPLGASGRSERVKSWHVTKDLKQHVTDGESGGAD